MSLVLAGMALAVIAGAVIAASSREARAGLVGLALALGLGPFLGDPLPSAALLGGRVVGAILVVYLLRALTTGGTSHALGSRIGWPAESSLALGAAVAGVAIAASLSALAPGGPGEPGGPGNGGAADPLGALTPSALALAVGLALVATGMAPAFLGRHALRTTIGLLLTVQGVVLARTGIAGPPGELEQLGIAGLLLAVGGAGALLVSAERRGDRNAAMPSGR